MRRHEYLYSEEELTEQQLQIVHSDEFKQWFGDWKNAPESASKIMDTGSRMPMVAYHGTKDKFDRFDPKTIKDGGFFFTPALEIAKSYTAGYGSVMEVFINAKRVLDVTDPHAPNQEMQDFITAYGEEFDEWVDRGSGEEMDVREFFYGQLFDYEGDWSVERWRRLMWKAESAGYDAILALDHNSSYANPMSIIVFDPDNIRLVSSFAQVRESILLFEQFVARKR